MVSVIGRDTPCVRNGEVWPACRGTYSLDIIFFFLRKYLIFDLTLNSGRGPRFLWKVHANGGEIFKILPKRFCFFTLFECLVNLDGCLRYFLLTTS
jgi:hypothetical protein